jgi:hypothetical protein
MPLPWWQKLTGPGEVTFPSSASGPVSFSAHGVYTLRLSADDGSMRTFDDTSVTVVSQFLKWQSVHFGAGADPSIAGPRADPDHDGLENLAEYALTSDPRTADTSAAPVSSRSGDTLSMRWRESSTATDVTVMPQWSDDYRVWHFSELTTEILTSGPGWVEKRVAFDIAGRPRALLRLLVTTP